LQLQLQRRHMWRRMLQRRRLPMPRMQHRPQRQRTMRRRVRRRRLHPPARALAYWRRGRRVSIRGARRHGGRDRSTAQTKQRDLFERGHHRACGSAYHYYLTLKKRGKLS
jgi:hypothetical protein